MVVAASTAMADRNATNYHNTAYYDAPHTWGPRSISPLKATPNLISNDLVRHNLDGAWKKANVLIQAGYKEGVLDGERGASKEDKPRRHFDVSWLIGPVNALSLNDTTNKWGIPRGYDPVAPIKSAIYSGANKKDVINILQHNLDVIYHIGFVNAYEATWEHYSITDQKARAMVEASFKQQRLQSLGNIFMKPFM